MDFTTLKRRIETGAVVEVNPLVTDLNLIFDNAMVYNGKGTDYYRMAQTLKDIVRVQQGIYTRWRQEHGGTLGAGVVGAPGGSAATPDAEMEVEPEAETGEADAGDGGAGGGDASGGRLRRGRRGARS